MVSLAPGIDPQRSVADFVIQSPALSRVFEQFGIDYCCGGKQSLADACRQAGAAFDVVARSLASCLESGGTGSASSGASATPSLAELATHIVDRHHVYLRRELPRLGQLIDKVVSAHGAKHPELSQVSMLFRSLEAELMNHMLKEERVLFPIVKTLEEAAAASRPVPAFHCGSIENPIAVMEDEHQHAGAALARMRELTAVYSPPEDACPTYIAMLSGLAELEADLHTHIHLENNILFPRAAALEARLSGRAETD